MKKGNVVLLFLVLYYAIYFFNEKFVDNSWQTQDSQPKQEEMSDDEFKYRRIINDEKKTPQKQMKKENGWVREYGRFSGELIVEKFYENGVEKIHQDYSFGKKMRELHYKDKTQADYKQVLYYLNSGNLMVEMIYENRKLVGGKCFDNDGKEYPFDKKKVGDGMSGPVQIPTFDKKTKKELNTASYIEHGIVYTLCQ